MSEQFLNDARTAELWEAVKSYVNERTGGDASHGGEVYSTEEAICGTWIDGRPVYKITVTRKLAQNATVNETAYTFPANVKIDFPISIEGIALSYGTDFKAYPISSCSEGAESSANWIGYAFVFFRKASREVVFRWSSYGLSEGTIFITIKYVKTTD